MAALDFPTATTVGQTATLTNGVTYRWDGAVWTAGLAGGPPTGTAGGDLTGSYPNPTIGAGAVGNAEISDVAYGKVTGAPTIPTTLPPSGAAGGDLAGTYPNPDIKALAVGTPELADGAVTDVKVTSVAYGKVTGAPTALPPSGTAGGDLSGSYPNPAIAAGVIVDADVSAAAAIQYTKLTGVPTALPPNGAASGDLTGTYPGPTVAAAKITAAKLSPAPVAGDVGKMVTVGAGPALTYTAVPTALPPSGAAGGDLTGTYPDPTIGALKVTDAKVNDVAATKLTGTIAQARFPVAPSGLLTANVNDAQITDVKIVGVAYSKVTGTPTALPPSGAASGDLGGSYPGPTIAKLNGATVGTTTPLARGDVLVGNATPALTRLALGTVNQVLQSNGTDVVWGPAPATGGPPTGTAGGDLSGSYPNPQLAAGVIVDADVSATAAIQYSKLTGTPTALPPSGTAGGSLAGTYPTPTLAASAVRGTPSSGGTAREIAKASIWGGDDLIDASVPDAKIAAVGATKLTGTIAQARLPVAPSGLLTANLNDSQVTAAKLAVGASVRQVVQVTVPTAIAVTTTAWTDVVTLSITTSGGTVILIGAAAWFGDGPANAIPLYWTGIGRDSVTATWAWTHRSAYSYAGSASMYVPLPLAVAVDTPTAGAHVYHLVATIGATGTVVRTAPAGQGAGYFWAVELS